MDSLALPAATAIAPPPSGAQAVLHAPDLDSAEQVFLGLLPDRAHVDALARQAVRLAREQAGSGCALSLTLVGLRLQEFKMGEACAAQCRHDSLRSLRQTFAASC